MCLRCGCRRVVVLRSCCVHAGEGGRHGVAPVPHECAPYLFGHFLILSFFHLFRFSAYPALVLGTFFGPTVCSFPSGCKDMIISAGISKSARLVAINAVICCIYLPAEHSLKVRCSMRHVHSDPNTCLSVLLQPSHTTSTIQSTKSPFTLIPLTPTRLRANLLNGVEDEINIGHTCLLSPGIGAEGDDFP